MKQIVLRSITVIAVLITMMSLTGCDRSNGIKDAFISSGFSVSEESLEHEAVNAYLEHLSEEQIEKIKEYDILYCSVPNGTNPAAKAVIIVCPDSGEVKDFLNMNNDGMYDDMKEARKIKGNCILFTWNYRIIDIFNDYFIINIMN